MSSEVGEKKGERWAGSLFALPTPLFFQQSFSLTLSVPLCPLSSHVDTPQTLVSVLNFPPLSQTYHLCTWFSSLLSPSQSCSVLSLSSRFSQSAQTTHYLWLHPKENQPSLRLLITGPFSPMLLFPCASWASQYKYKTILSPSLSAGETVLPWCWGHGCNVCPHALGTHFSISLQGSQSPSAKSKEEGMLAWVKTRQGMTCQCQRLLCWGERRGS